MAVLFFLSFGFLLYVYVGYPLALQLLVWTRGARPVRRGTAVPRVTLVISAYNEAAVIRAKLENALALDYPEELLQIAVISDASSDGTDDIVREFAPRVELLRQPDRKGKTAGLNRFVPALSGDIIVFSDANAMYKPNAIRMLVRNFEDPAVGCVTGEALYLEDDRSAAGISERVYWNYEIWIKRMETAVGSMVGGDGAIYAIRRPLWWTLPENAINDFLNPLQIVVAGYRGVYEPDAICYEETAGMLGREWRRRVRIVSRSWRAVFQARGALNPFRGGLFFFCLISHKVLRWFSGLFVLLAAGAAATLVWDWSFLGSSGALIVAAALAMLLVPQVRRGSMFLFYFAVINAASLVGVVRGTFGKISGVWTPPRGARSKVDTTLRPGSAVVAVAFTVLVAGATTLVLEGVPAAASVFWTSVAVLVYVYVGYPLALRLAATVMAKPVVQGPMEARVCLFVAAHNEAEVIADKIRNSLALDYPRSRLHILIASDGSSDSTNEIVRSFASQGVQLVEFLERRGKISAINDGMKAVDAEIVVLSDANTFLRPDAIRNLVRNFADETVGAVSGDVILTGERAALAGSEDLYYRYERALQRFESELGSLIGVDGALYALRRRLFVPAAPDTILDDMAIPMAVVRAGYRVVFEPDALAYEIGSNSAREEFARKSRVIAGGVQFLMRDDSSIPVRDVQAAVALVSHKALRWMSPAFAMMGVASALMLAPDSFFYSTVLAVQIVVLAGGAIGCVPSARRRLAIVSLAHYLCLVQTAAAVGLIRGLTGRQPVAWRRFARPRAQSS